MPSSRSLDQLRAQQRQLLVRTLRQRGPTSRAELTRITDIPRASVSTLVRELLAAGEVGETGETARPHHGGSGRPGRLLQVLESHDVVVGIDVGHRHLRVAAARGRTVLAEHETEMDVDHDAQRTLDRVAALTAKVLKQANVSRSRARGAVVGIPGPISQHTGRLTSEILPAWKDLDLAHEFGQRLNMPVEVDNDANLGALGEQTFGGAAELSDFIYLKVASGVGAGLVLGGSLYRGATGIAGELGHVPVDPQGPICRCGNRGCLDTVVAAHHLVELLQPAYDEPLTTARMLADAHAGHAAANRILEDAGTTIGRVLAHLANSLNPEAIIIGGTLSASTSLTTAISTAVKRQAQPNTAAALNVVSGQLGDRAEVLGAVAGALTRFQATPTTPAVGDA